MATTLLARHIATEISNASALEAKIKSLVSEVKSRAEAGFYSATVDISPTIYKHMRDHFTERGFIVEYEKATFKVNWKFPVDTKPAQNTARHFLQVTRDVLDANFDKSVELVNNDIEKAAQNGRFSCDVYSLSVHQNNLTPLLDLLHSNGYEADHSGSYIHIGWED